MNSDFDALLADFHAQRCRQAEAEVVGEFEWQGQRLVVAHRPDVAAELTARREARIAELEAEAARLAGKLDAQDGGQRHKGRKLSDSGAKTRFYQAVCEAKLAAIIKVELRSDLFAYEIDQRALARARMMDGELVLVSNMPDASAEDFQRSHMSLPGDPIVLDPWQTISVPHRNSEGICGRHVRTRTASDCVMYAWSTSSLSGQRQFQISATGMCRKPPDLYLQARTKSQWWKKYRQMWRQESSSHADKEDIGEKLER